jgi:hypothetical protein
MRAKIKIMEIIMTTKNYDEVRALIESYAKQEQQIRSNGDLSESGKAKKLAAIQKDRKNLLHTMIDKLRQDAVLAAINHERKAGVVELMGELDAEKLDWSRLQYEASAVQSAVARSGGDVFAVAEAWDKAKASNDKYKLKAWRDILPANIPKNSLADKEWQNLMQDVEKANLVVLSGEQLKVKVEQDAMLQELSSISDAATQAASAVGADERIVLGRVFDGIQKDGEGLKLGFNAWADDKPEKIYQQVEQDYHQKLDAQHEVNKAFGVEGYYPNYEGVGE